MKKKIKRQPKINTSALPDIIFMLLFFFMVVTVLRDQQIMVKNILPKATELQKLEHPSLVTNIYVGQPLNPNHGNMPITQINDAFIHKDHLEQAIRTQNRNNQLHQSPRAITALKIDQEVSMGIVTDVKTALRKAGRLKVSYVAKR